MATSPPPHNRRIGALPWRVAASQGGDLRHSVQAGAKAPLLEILHPFRDRLEKHRLMWGRGRGREKIHAALIDELSAAGVDQISFDVDFSSPSTDEQDGILEDALRRAGGGVVLAAFSQKFSSDLADLRIWYNWPIARFAQNAWSGAVNVFSDRDGVVKEFPDRPCHRRREPTPSMPMLIANGEAELGREFLIDFGILRIRHRLRHLCDRCAWQTRRPPPPRGQESDRWRLRHRVARLFSSPGFRIYPRAARSSSRR